MSSPAVDALLFRLGPHRLAVELHLVSSVLQLAEARGMGQLDPRPHLLPTKESSSRLPPATDDQLVGLVDTAGPPIVLLLGEVLGAKSLTRQDLLYMPPWIATGLPAILRPQCARIDDNVVWLLDLDTLTMNATS